MKVRENKLIESDHSLDFVVIIRATQYNSHTLKLNQQQQNAAV